MYVNKKGSYIDKSLPSIASSEKFALQTLKSIDSGYSLKLFKTCTPDYANPHLNKKHEWDNYNIAII